MAQIGGAVRRLICVTEPPKSLRRSSLSIMDVSLGRCGLRTLPRLHRIFRTADCASRRFSAIALGSTKQPFRPCLKARLSSTLSLAFIHARASVFFYVLRIH
jgi:hypothetical protein